jgi:23S rRNA (pseudouridine1915-N3)-methyltransferase
MNIKILCPGKSKQEFIKSGIREYLKRISAYAKIELIELPDVKLTSTNNIAIVKDKEAKIIEKHLVGNSYLIVLDESGQQMDSEVFSKFLNNISNKKLTFIIGGVYGLSEVLLRRADFRLSFSKMTFTHQMIRFILTEQIYRAITIIKGKKYHY